MCQNDSIMSKTPRHRRPLIEALEPRLLFSATADIAVFDDGNSEGQYIAQAAQNADLVSIYKSDEWADFAPFVSESTATAEHNGAVIFIDTAVENYQTLVKDIQAIHGDQFTIIYLDATKDGVSQLSEYFAAEKNISAVHIISHGVAGSLQLGSGVLDQESLARYEQPISQWKDAFTGNADILLYGCDLAANAQGIDFLRQLSQLTGADVAASNDLTGTAKNADWVLEENIGVIETASIFTSGQSIEWQGVLADVVHLYSGAATNEQAIPAGGDVKQGVQLTSTKTLDRIQIMLANHGSSATSVQLLVHQSSYNGTVIASASVNASTIGNSLEWIDFDFAQTSLQAYAVYWVEVKTNNGADNLISVGYVNSNVIASEFVVNNSGDAARDMAIALIDTNRAPVLANAIPNQFATEESLFSYTLPANTFSDPDGEALTYSAALANGNPLPSWLAFNASTRTFSGMPNDSDVGTLSVRVTAVDGKGGSASDTFDLTITNINDAPVLNLAIPHINATEDSPFNYTIPATTFTDADAGATLVYTAQLAGGGSLPAWLHFDSATRTFSGTPANGDVGTLSIKITASDGLGGSANDIFDITVINVNDAPTLASPVPNQTATENVLFNYTFAINTFNDQDVGTTLIYSATLVDGSALPTWLNFDSATRTFSGTPLSTDVGTISIRLTASDGVANVSDTFDIEIKNVDTINSIIDTSGPTIHTQIFSPGQPIYQSFTNNFGAGTYEIDSIILQLKKSPATLSQTITVSLIEGAIDSGVQVASTSISSDSLSTTLNWHAFNFNNTLLDDSTIYFIRVETSGSDSTIAIGIHNTDRYPEGMLYYAAGNSAPDRDLAFQIVSGTDTDPVLMTPIENQIATEDSAFIFQFDDTTFYDPDGDTLSYTATLDNGDPLPAWLSFDPATRTFSGTPANEHVGVFSVKVRAADPDGGVYATDSFDITVVNQNDAPVVANPIADQNATEDSPFNFTFPANTFFDEDLGDSLSYSVQLSGGGALPTWISFDAITRTFSGTPANNDVGTFSITITASDGMGGSVSDTFTITVTNTNDAPIILAPLPDQIATEDVPFTFQFSSAAFTDEDDGDLLVYSAQLAGGGALPSWLTFDAATLRFSGTPANEDVGIFSVAVTATDISGSLVTDVFTITVVNVNDEPLVTILSENYYTTEQTILNLHGTGISIEDVDTNNLSVTISASAPASTLNAVTGTTGVSIMSGNGTATLVISGSLAQLNEFLAGSNGGTLTFQSESDTPAATATLTITASDGFLTTSDTAIINIAAVNDAPQIIAPITQSLDEDTLLVFSTANGNQIQISDPDAGTADVEVTLTVTNGTLTLAGTNGLTFSNGDGNADSSVTFSGTLANINAALSTLTYISAANYNGTATLSITTSDLGNTGTGGVLTATDSVTIIVNALNDAPASENSIPDRTATQDLPFSFQIPANTFADPDGDTLTYSAQLTGGGAIPSWLTFDAATRTFSGTPLNGDVGSIVIDVIARDGEASVVAQFLIYVAPVNDTPTVVALTPLNTFEDATGDSLDLFAIFDDEETPVRDLRYSVVSNSNPSLVANAVFDMASGKLLFRYGLNQFGYSDLIIRAQDSDGAFVDAALRINVAAVNDTPVSHGIPDISVEAGSAPQQLNLHDIFSDIEEGTSLAYSVVGNTNPSIVPTIYWDQGAGVMRMNFASASSGDTVITLRAQDSEGAWVDTQFKVTVTQPLNAPEQPETPRPPSLPPIYLPDTEVLAPPVDQTNPDKIFTPIPAVQSPDESASQLAWSSGPPDVIADGSNDFSVPDDKSSRDYERMAAQLSGQKVSGVSLNAPTSFLGLITTDGLAPWDAAEFDNEVRRIRAQMDSAMDEEQSRREIIAGITFSITTGVLVWSLRASSLLLALMSILPLWRGFDPLPILDEVNKRKKELEQQRKDRAREDKCAKEVGYLFDHAQHKKN